MGVKFECDQCRKQEQARFNATNDVIVPNANWYYLDTFDHGVKVFCTKQCGLDWCNGFPPAEPEQLKLDPHV